MVRQASPGCTSSGTCSDGPHLGSGHDGEAGRRGRRPGRAGAPGAPSSAWGRSGTGPVNHRRPPVGHRYAPAVPVRPGTPGRARPAVRRPRPGSDRPGPADDRGRWTVPDGRPRAAPTASSTAPTATCPSEHRLDLVLGRPVAPGRLDDLRGRRRVRGRDRIGRRCRRPPVRRPGGAASARWPTRWDRACGSWSAASTRRPTRPTPASATPGRATGSGRPRWPPGWRRSTATRWPPWPRGRA